MGRLPPKSGSGQEQFKKPIFDHSYWKSIRRGILIASTIISFVLLVLFSINEQRTSKNEEYFFHVVCHNDGRKIFDQVLKEETGPIRTGGSGVDIHFVNTSGKIVFIPDNCIIEQVERPSYWAANGR